MLLLIDNNLYQEGGKELFAQFNNIGRIVPIGSFSSSAAKDLIPQANALIIRSTLQVNAELIKKAQDLTFVGSATAGSDHLDKEYLNKRGISWINAPGCNADAVADYAFSCFALLNILEGLCKGSKSLGLVGFGQVGKRITKRLQAMANLIDGRAKIVVYDPFIDWNFEDPIINQSQSSFEEVLNADCIVIVCSLTKQPKDKASYCMFDKRVIFYLSATQTLINLARGEIIKEDAVLEVAAQKGKAGMPLMIMDLWNNEPSINTEFMKLCHISTPHIAGYSLIGKQNALNYVFWHFYQHFNIDTTKEGDISMLGDPFESDYKNHFLWKAPKLLKDESPEYYVKRVLLQNYDPMVDSIRTKKTILSSVTASASFTKLRNNYILRRQGTQWQTDKLPPIHQKMLNAALGL